MPLRVFVAGATGVVGGALLPRLRERNHATTALVRTAERAERVEADEVVVGDVLDPDGLRELVVEAAPDVVVQATSGFRGVDAATGLQRTARLREAGTRNLVEAASAAGARRIVALSTAAAYCPDGEDVLDEDAPLWTEAPGRWGEMVRSVSTMEQTVLTSPEVEGVVLRCGSLYGPGTGYAPGGAVHEKVRGSELPIVSDGVGISSFTHVDDAVGAILEVLNGGDPAAYNVVDNEPTETTEWLPAYARMVGGPEPVSLTTEQARAQLDWITVHQLTEQRGATNFRIRETLGWRPSWPSWREGFATLFGLWPG